MCALRLIDYLPKLTFMNNEKWVINYKVPSLTSVIIILCRVIMGFKLVIACIAFHTSAYRRKKVLMKHRSITYTPYLTYILLISISTKTVLNQIYKVVVYRKILHIIKKAIVFWRPFVRIIEEREQMNANKGFQLPPLI